MNDLNAIVGIFEGKITASESFSTVFVYVDKNQPRVDAPPQPVETRTTAKILWQE